MPNGKDKIKTGLEFPAFPSLLSEKETERLKELEEQKKRIEQVYKAKFAPKAWEQVSVPEKAIREWLAPTTLKPVVGAILPWQWGWDWGLTPEQSREETEKVITEYKELARREKVSTYVTPIMETLRSLALSEEDIVTDAGQLRAIFKLDELGFNEEEVGYIVQYAQSLLKATPEQLVSGKPWGIRPVTEEEMEYLREPLFIDPRFILSTVAFSKDIEAITEALKLAYPPQVAEEPYDTRKERIIKAWSDYLGKKDDESTLDAATRTFENIVKKEGELVTLTNLETGEIGIGKVRQDNTVWFEGNLIGYFNTETGKLVLLSPSGVPILTEGQKELMVKDFWDAAYLSLSQSWLDIRQWALNAIPFQLSQSTLVPPPMIDKQILSERDKARAKGQEVIVTTSGHSISLALSDEDFLEAWREEYFSPEEVEFYKGMAEERENLVKTYEADYLAREEDYRVWLAEKIKTHPELAPRPGWDEPMIDRWNRNPSSLLDVGYLGYQLSSNINTFIAMGLSIGITYATKNPTLGLATAVVLFTPLETESLRSDLVDAGASYELATEISVPAGAYISSLECVGDYPVLKAVAPQFFKAFERNLQKSVAQSIVHYALTTGKIVTVETFFEEVPQEVLHNAYVKTVDENRDLLENVPETILQSILVTAPLGVLGGGTEYIQTKRYLPKAVSQKLDTDSQALQDAGIPKEQADLIVYNELAGTETGRAQIELAQEKATEQVPTTPEEKTNKITKADKRLSTINKDIATFSNSIKLQQERLAKQTISFERAETQETINNLQEQLDELEVKKAKLIESLAKAREVKVVPTPVEEVTPVTPEVMAYRGVTEGKAPVDEGTMGKGEYWSTSREYALTYGKKLTKAQVDTTGFLRIETQAQWDEFSGRTRELREQAVREGKDEHWVQQTLRDQLEGEGYSGVYVAPGIIERGAQLVVFHPAEVVAEPTLTIESVVYKVSKGYGLNREETQFYQQHFEEVEQKVAADREEALAQIREAAPRARAALGKLIQDLTYRPSEAMPRLPDLDTELKRVEQALDANPNLKGLIRVSKKPGILRGLAKETLNRLQSELREAETAGNEDVVKEKTKALKDIGKDTRLGAKTLLAKSWDDLTPSEQMKVALSLVPDHSISSGIVDDFRDTALVVSDMDSETDLHFLDVFERIETVRGYCLRLQDKYFKRITNVPKWRKIVRNRASMDKVALIIDSRREGSTTKVADPITEKDFLMVEVADAMAAVNKEWEPIVRFLRFTEAYEASPTAASIKEKIPDAPDEDINMALTILEGAGEDALWAYLGDKSWGVIGSGYSPWRISRPNLEVTEPRWTATRGAGYLMSRDSTQMPWEARRGLLATYDSYNLSMALRYFLRREIQYLANDFNISYKKWTNPDHVQDYLRKYLRAVQSFPDEDNNFFLRIMRKMQSWSHPNIFWHPFRGFRNVLQFIWSYPYRTELIRALWEFSKIPASVRFKLAERFATNIDQSGRPLRQWMFQEEEIHILGEVPQWVRIALAPFKLITKPLDFLSAQCAKIPTMAITDKASRSATCKTSFNKAWRATEQYKRDNNAKRWFDNSGINSGYITREQQAHIIGLLALGNEIISWATPGLTEVTGYEAACIRIAEETTSRTLYLYDRAIAAGVHRGGGRTFSSLFTFPRSTVQMYAQQIARVVSPDSTVTERLASAKNVLLLWLVGDLLSSFLMVLSGRRRKEYSIVNTITWSFGGLGVGIASDLFDFLNDIITASGGTQEDKDRVWARLPSEAARLGDVLIGFYEVLTDTMEALVDEEEGIDTRFIRKIRSWFDDKYTPEEVEKAERTVLEMVQKILMGQEAPDPDVFEKSQDILMKEEARLGEIGLTGESYTVKQFGGKIDQVLNNIPDYLVIEEAGWSELVMFHSYCSDSWREYYTLPTTPSRIRTEWRESHLEEEAMLLFWGKLDSSVWRRGSPEGEEIMRLLRFWWDRYDIDRSKRPEASWADGGKIVEE